MNWYLEQNGVSVGPVTEQELASRVRAAETGAETLIWHPGLDEWQAVGVLKPDLLKPVTVEQPRVAPPAKKQPAFKSLAPEGTTKEPEAHEKPGFFKRLFGKK